jgi:DnaJ like chaperone protein
MSLSAPEIASIVIGLAGGFWLVSSIMDGRAHGPKPEDPARQRASEAHTGRTQQDAGPRPRDEPAPQWWEVLGVPRIATRDEVTRAYKRKISEYHPDKVAQLGEEIRAVAERKSKEINAAYDEAMRRF